MHGACIGTLCVLERCLYRFRGSDPRSISRIGRDVEHAHWIVEVIVTSISSTHDRSTVDVSFHVCGDGFGLDAILLVANGTTTIRPIQAKDAAISS